MANDIDDLRGHLFDTLKALRDPENPMELGRAKAISDVAQTIINAAKVEVDYQKVAGARASKFLEPDEAPPALPAGITGSLVHRIK